MARYEIELEDDPVLHADDARFVADGRFLELIPRKASTVSGYPERLLLHTDHVRKVRQRAIGLRGGWRFGGEKDRDFAPSEGSMWLTAEHFLYKTRIM